MSEDPYARRPDASYMPVEDCVVGNLYAIASRNLIIGVFDGTAEAGFVGIREKFGSKYLFTEYHYDVGRAFGTVMPFLDLGPCPIEDLREYVGSQCTMHNRPSIYDRTKPKTVKAYDGQPLPVPGTWVHADDGSIMPDDDYSQANGNRALYDWLKSKEDTLDYEGLRDVWQPGYAASMRSYQE